MRYRRFSYRYALVLSPSVSQPAGGIRQAERTRVQPARTRWRPAADVYETPAAIVVTIDLPGIDHEALDVLLYEDAVVIEGERRLPTEEPGGMYHTAEIRQGPFRLELALPAAIDPEQVIARYEQGLLQMRLPKSKGR